jgi:ribonuclease HII
VPDFTVEAALGGKVCGVDEAGRGPWAGPVVAGAAVIDIERLPSTLRDRLDDSKKLTLRRREQVFAMMQEAAAVGAMHFAIAEASVVEIDTLNILHATMLAMTRAVAALPLVPDHALIDGNRVPDGLPCPGLAVVGGDARSLSIAAASIAAKVSRDRLMAALDAEFPGYGFARHAGYGAPDHQAALARLGPSPAHRRSFAPVRRLLEAHNI